MPLMLIGSIWTYPNRLASFKASVVDVNWNRASNKTDGNAYDERTILLANMTPREEVA